MSEDEIRDISETRLGLEEPDTPEYDEEYRPDVTAYLELGTTGLDPDADTDSNADTDEDTEKSLGMPSENEEGNGDGSEGSDETDPGDGMQEADSDAEGDTEEPASEDEPRPGEQQPDAEIEEIKEKIRQRKREKKRKAALRKVRFWTILSLVLLTAGAFIFSISGFFTVDSIEVKGNDHFTAEEIINIAHAVPGHNLIYDMDKKDIEDYLLQNPYIKKVVVTRKLPSTIVITVTERQQACAFKYDDDYLIMDDEGILLKKTRTEPKLTMVTGLVVSRLKLGETIGTQNQTMFGRLLRLIRTMNASDMYFVRIDMSDYEENGAVRAYIYDKLIVKTNYDLLMENLKNGRLHRVVEKLFEDGIKRGTITFSEDGTASFEPGF